MKKNEVRIEILPNQFLKEDGSFNRKEAVQLCGKIAGVCYDKEGFNHIVHEEEEKTMRRVAMTLNIGHHSVYDHINISLNLQNIPKILAMVLNNEHQYTTSEKSARYTPIVRTEGSIITCEEERLYNKWIDIFKIKIKESYGSIYNDSKIQKLAQENARYLVTVFVPTTLIYSTSLRQINYIASWMEDYIKVSDQRDSFQNKLAQSMKEFVQQLSDRDILVEELMTNEKERKLSLFGTNIAKRLEYFGSAYVTNYKGSFVQVAQAQRHRTLDYQIELLPEKQYFIPPIIEGDKVLVEEWLQDMQIVKEVSPQGELVEINEIGKYEDFILKCKERLCSAAQLEIMRQTKTTLLKYKKALEETNHPLAEDIQKYAHGARCTFPDYTCASICNFEEGKKLTRRI